MDFIFFGRVPSLRFGSGYCALRSRSVLRSRFALPNGMLRIPHANSILMFYLVFKCVPALLCLMLIIKHLKN
ncbi:MAG: hypothetical protein NZ519_07750 [Bacteroidia bacterium]|nr:hypothetical protein [Bacteroidia bacterium]